jgi:hypothetical protein
MRRDKYTTALGDEWDGISRKAYGDIRHSDMLAHLLLAANPQHQETVIFGSGTVLNIPEPPDIRAASLPPWMR